jgi:hypothetical protein
MCGWSAEWAAIRWALTVVRYSTNFVLCNCLLCSQVTITTRQLVSHLAGIRHYEKSSNSSSKNKETASMEVKDKKNVSLLSGFFVFSVFCYCSHVLVIACLISSFTITNGFPGL